MSDPSVAAREHLGYLGSMWMMMLACSGEEPEATPVDVSLIESEAWMLLDSESDPWDDGPAGTECSALGYEVEGPYFEVDTELCPYGTFSQPALHGVREGEELTIVYWYLDLWSTDFGAEGHVAISVGGDVLVEEFIEIPADAEVRPSVLSAPRDIAEGEEITFHIHNHGYNNWSMGTFEALTVP
jgi:hypothetical protein